MFFITFILTRLFFLALMLDHNQIPIDMKTYSGNESEKPVIRDPIASLKAKYNISGKNHPCNR